MLGRSLTIVVAAVVVAAVGAGGAVAGSGGRGGTAAATPRSGTFYGPIPQPKLNPADPNEAEYTAGIELVVLKQRRSREVSTLQVRARLTCPSTGKAVVGRVARTSSSSAPGSTARAGSRSRPDAPGSR